MNLFKENNIECTNAPEFQELLKLIDFPKSFNGSLIINSEKGNTIFNFKDNKLESVSQTFGEKIFVEATV